jgi:thioredoxin 1
MKNNLTSLIAVVVVVGLVAGVAWYRSNQPATNPGSTAGPGAAPVQPTSQPAKGELCPEPPPTAPPAHTEKPLVEQIETPEAAKVEVPEAPPSKVQPVDKEPEADGPSKATTTAPTTTGPATPTTAASTAKLPRVVDLGADKCKACKELAPILEELKKEYAGRMTVEFIDVWKNPKAGDPYKIRVIPTQIFFDADGKEVGRHEGFLPKADFIAKFKELGVK